MSSKNTERISFASRKNQLEYPDFLEIQLKSFGEFFQLGTTPENRKREGLFKVFSENFPITDTRNNFVLEKIFDMEAITKAAHKANAYAGFDLAHAAGKI